MNCREFEEKVYIYDELPAEARAACESHLASCAHCRAIREETMRLDRALASQPSPEPSPEMLAHCREMLEDALDRELARRSWPELLREAFSAFSFVPYPRFAAGLTLLVLGFSVGWTLRPRVKQGPGAVPGVSSASFLGGDLSNLRINDISQVAPDPQTGSVKITLNAERRVTLEGSLDDPRIRQVLVDAVKSYDNAGIRRDSLDILRSHLEHASVRDALLYAMTNDSNAGMRLEALKAVRTMEYGPDVREALLEVVQKDTNPGVRVGAIDTLLDHSEEVTKDPATLAVLKQLSAEDPCQYVRLKSQSALRKLEPGN